MTSRLQRVLGAPDIRPETYRFIVVMSYVGWSGLVSQSLFALVFATLRIPVLAGFALVSCALYAGIALVAQRARLGGLLILAGLVTLAHAGLSVSILGWDSGFHYYVPLLVPLVFFNPTWHRSVKWLVVALICALYLGLHTRAHVVEPSVVLDVATLTALHHVNVMLTFVILSFLGYYYSRAAEFTEREMEAANVTLRRLATTDPLTRLLNRRSMEDRLYAEMARFTRNGRPFALVMADIDDFKPINDRYGHECGDHVLVELATLIHSSLRRQDEAARWGGEEFLLLLPETTLKAAAIVAERLRRMVANSTFTYDAQEISITLTFGVSVCGASLDVNECVAEADHAMYSGKRGGKNCVVLAGAS